ncbi:MAG TPA: NAD(P)-dependent oxidoreductase [Kribbellaceae bacterium]|jgi:hypothetical protein
MHPLLVVTGGLGRVAGVLRSRLAERYELRLVDRETGRAAPGDVIVADLAVPGAAGRVLAGADAVLHLAGDADPRIGWDRAYRANVVPARAVLDAAARHRIPRVVLASSLHVLGEYNRPEYRPVSDELPPRPCCPYGLSKVVVEALGRLHAGTTGASVVCLRLGLTGWPLTEARYLGMWLSDDDAGRLVRAALTTTVRYGTYIGVSANTRHHWDTAHAADDLGYHPHDDSEHLAATAGPPTETLCRLFGESENTPYTNPRRQA